MTDIAHLIAKFDSDVSGFMRGSSSVQGRMSAISSGAMRTGSTLTRGLTLPLVGVAAAATKMALDFDAEMSNIRALVGASEEDMKSYEKSIMALAPATGKGPKELAQALYFVTSSGFEGAAALKILDASARTAAAGLGSTEDVADLVTSAMNAYGEENLSAARATDILAAAVREGKNEPDELAGALGRVLAPAQAMGVEFQEVAGGVAALSLVGLDAAEGVTALRGSLMGIMKPTKATRELLEDAGISLSSLRKEIADKGLLPTFGKLAKQFKGNQDAIGTLFPNVRALNAFLALTGSNAQKVREVMKGTADSTGAVNKAFATASKDGMFKINQAWASIQTSMIQVGQVLVPIVARVADTVAGLATKFSALDPSTKKLILILGGVAAAIGPILLLFGAMFSPIGALVVALGGLVFGLSRTEAGLGGFTKKGQELISSLRPLLNFFRSELGMAVSVGVIAFGGFAVAVAKAITVLKTLRLVLFGVHPLIGAIAIAVGLLAGAWITSAMSVGREEKAVIAAKDALLQYAQAANLARGQSQTLTEAKHRLKQADLDIRSAIQQRNTLEQDANATSAQRRQAELSVEAAFIARKRAAGDLDTAEKALETTTKKSTAAQQLAKGAAEKLRAEFVKIRDETNRSASATQGGTKMVAAMDKVFRETKAKEFAEKMRELATRARNVADANRDANPKVATLMDTLARQASETAKLAIKMKDIPGAVAAVKGPAVAEARAVGIGIQSGILSGVGGLAGALASRVSYAVGAALKSVDIPGGSPPEHAAAKFVGEPLGRGVVRGFLLGSASLPDKMKDSLRKALESSQRYIESQRTRMSNAFSTMMGDAFAAFDRIAQNHLTPSELILKTEEDRRAAERLQESLKQSKADLAAAMASGEGIAGAQRAVADAEWEIRRVGLEQAAARERLDFDAQQEIRRRRLDAQLQQLQAKLALHPEAHAKIQRQILTLLRQHGVTYKSVGENLGNAFAAGLRASLGQIRAAAKRAAAEVAKYLKLKSPSERGPLATLDEWWKPFAPTLLAGLDTGAITAATLGLGAPALAAAGRGASGATGAATGSQVFHAPLIGEYHAHNEADPEVLAATLARKVVFR